jgi:hypothetical protein
MKLPRSSVSLAIAVFLGSAAAHAGPPYVTDDPEPVERRHWEFYVATQHSVTDDDTSGTAPHVEVNYGAAQDLQIHLIVPLAYDRPASGPNHYGLGDLELGVKYRFLQEGKRQPMMGIFPQLELPTGSASDGLGTGRLHVFIPLWLQKSFDPWTMYGGAGYWINPGEGNRDYGFAGWQIQRRLSDLVTLGTEVFYTTPDRIDGRDNLGSNVGLVLDFNEHHHLLFSAGRSVVGDTDFQAYLGYQLTR